MGLTVEWFDRGFTAPVAGLSKRAEPGPFDRVGSSVIMGVAAALPGGEQTDGPAPR